MAGLGLKNMICQYQGQALFPGLLGVPPRGETGQYMRASNAPCRNVDLVQ